MSHRLMDLPSFTIVSYELLVDSLYFLQVFDAFKQAKGKIGLKWTGMETFDNSYECWQFLINKLGGEWHASQSPCMGE